MIRAWYVRIGELKEFHIVLPKKTTTIKQNQTETKKKKKKEERKRTHDYLLMDSQRTCGRIEKSLDMFGLSTPGNRKLIES